MSAHYTITFVVWIVLASICLLIALLWLAYAIVYRVSEKDGTGLIVGAAVTVLVVVAGGVAGLYPYDKAFHQVRPVQGTVADVSSRVLGSSNAFEQKFVIRFRDDPTLYGCQDTRCSLVKLGDHIALMCQAKWQYQATPGQDCRWRDR